MAHCIFQEINFHGLLPVLDIQQKQNKNNFSLIILITSSQEYFLKAA